MKNPTFRHPALWIIPAFLVAGLAFSGCQRTSQQVKILQSRQVQRDFYTCKGFDAAGLPYDVTTEFHVDDNLIYIVANLEKEQLGNRLNFEISSPDNYISFTESVNYEQNRPYAYYFDTHKLYERGGGGRWRVLFWASGQPMGRLFFHLSGPDDERRRRMLDGPDDLFESIFGRSAAPAPAIPKEPISDATPEFAPVEEEERQISPDMETSIDMEIPAETDDN